MKTVFLMGGVGNRLFQLAHAKSLQKYHEDVEVIELPALVERVATIFDWSYHVIWIDFYGLATSLNIRHRQANFIEICKIVLTYLSRKLLRFNFNFDQTLGDISKKNRLRIGYFQTLSHIDASSVRDVAHSVSKILGINMGDQEVIHIRGGDFNLQDRLSGIIFSKILTNNPKIEVITNDIDYVRTSYVGANQINFYISGSAKLDFIRIASSRAVYPSDSTFGFWAAYIANQNGAKVHFLTNNRLWEFF